MSQIGSQVMDGGTSPLEKGRKLQGNFKAAVAAKAPPAAATLAGNRFLAVADLPDLAAQQEIKSDTGQITLNSRRGYLLVDTPRSAGIVVPDADAYTAGPLGARDSTAFCTVSASAMDGRDITSSRRLLLFHLTNIQNTDMRFTDASLKTLLNNGRLPFLARTGKVEVALKNANPGLKLYPLNSDGTRMAPISAAYASGAYIFTLAVGSASAAPTMMYELAP